MVQCLYLLDHCTDLFTNSQTVRVSINSDFKFGQNGDGKCGVQFTCSYLLSNFSANGFVGNTYWRQKKWKKTYIYLPSSIFRILSLSFPTIILFIALILIFLQLYQFHSTDILFIQKIILWKIQKEKKEKIENKQLGGQECDQAVDGRDHPPRSGLPIDSAIIGKLGWGDGGSRRGYHRHLNPDSSRI